ncbi:MAG: hypothetical protein ACRELY_26655 [Polyangiaceae bacterium]
MSPEAKASAAALARLLAEIEEDRAGMRKRVADADEATRRLTIDRADPAALALAGVAIHGWYTAIESLFERVARELDGSLPTGDRWHRDLLSQMSAEVPGVRPKVIEPELVADLGSLLAFRPSFVAPMPSRSTQGRSTRSFRGLRLFA